MHWLAKHAGVNLETEDRKDGTDYVFLDGKPVLTFLTHCRPQRIATKAAWGEAAGDVHSLLENMKQLAPRWGCFLDPVEGTLTLFVD